MTENKNYRRDIYIFTFIAAALVVLDQVTKNLIVKKFQMFQQKDIIKGFFSFYYTRNTGSAFSFLADKSWGIYVLTAISFTMSILLYVVLLRAIKLGDKITSFAFTLFIAGAVGNLIDRALYRSVVDFIRFDFGSYTFPIFNIADICAVCATGLLIGILLFGKNKIERIMDSFDKKKESETKTETTEEVADGV